jgi:hypothetical protein
MNWYVLLAPLLLLPIVSLLAFVGCSLDQEGGWAGVPVTIKWTTSQLIGHVLWLQFACDYDEDSGPKTKPTKSLSDFSPGSVVLHLTSSFRNPVVFTCVCRGTATLPDGVATIPIEPSPPVEFTSDSKLEFTLQVTFQLDDQPPTFSLKPG